MEVGHTQSAGDSMHACIEKYTNRKSVFTQKEWANYIKECKVENPYNVKEINQDMIYDFDPLAKIFYWKIAKLSTIREVKISPNSPVIQIKTNFFERSKEINVLKRNVSLKDIIDLSLMISKNLIPTYAVQDLKEIIEINEL